MRCRAESDRQRSRPLEGSRAIATAAHVVRSTSSAYPGFPGEWIETRRENAVNSQPPVTRMAASTSE